MALSVGVNLGRRRSDIGFGPATDNDVDRDGFHDADEIGHEAVDCRVIGRSTEQAGHRGSRVGE